MPRKKSRKMKNINASVFIKGVINDMCKCPKNMSKQTMFENWDISLGKIKGCRCKRDFSDVDTDAFSIKEQTIQEKYAKMFEEYETKNVKRLTPRVLTAYTQHFWGKHFSQLAKDQKKSVIYNAKGYYGIR